MSFIERLLAAPRVRVDPAAGNLASPSHRTAVVRRLLAEPLPPQTKLKPLHWLTKEVWKLAEKHYRDTVAW